MIGLLPGSWEGGSLAVSFPDRERVFGNEFNHKGNCNEAPNLLCVHVVFHLLGMSLPGFVSKSGRGRGVGRGFSSMELEIVNLPLFPRRFL